MTLTEPVTHKASLFTLSEGSLPVFTTSLYCRGTSSRYILSVRLLHASSGCHRRYYHNFDVHKQSSTRRYYEGVPGVLQAAQHFFIESDLLEFFANGKVFGW